MKYKRRTIKDKPYYEIYSKYDTSGDIDIPDEEIDNELKRLMKYAIDNPRMFERIRGDLLDIFENELQHYAEKQFYEEGRGKVYKDSMKVHDVTLHYNDLELTVLGKSHQATQTNPGYSEEIEITEDFDYDVEENEVKDCLFDYLSDEEEFDDMTNEQLGKYIEDNFDKLIDEYEDNLKKHFEERAIKAATEYFQNVYND